MTSVAAVISLLLAALAASLAANRNAPAENVAVRIVTWFIVFASLIVLPIHLGAALQLLGAVPRVPLALPGLISGLMAAWLLARRTAPPPPPPPPPLVPLSESGRAEAMKAPRASVHAAVIIGGAYVIFAIDRLSSFPSSWDGVAYHLPLALKWLQEGSLAIGATTDWRESLPANGEIIAMLALGTGWQALAELWNVASAVGLSAGSYLLAQSMGVSRSAALAGAVVVAGMPIVLFQAFSAYVDLFGAACLIGGLGIFVHLASGPHRPPAAWTVVVAGLGCGLAVGTKPTLWPAAALLAIAVLVWVVRSRGSGSIGRALIFTAATAAPCIFWFVRSLVATGNPVYPLAVEVAGWTVFKGIRPSELTASNYYLEVARSRLEWLVYPWIEFKRSGYSFSTGSGLGPLFATFVPVGLLYTLGTLRDRSSGPARTIQLACVGGLLAGVAVWWMAGQGPLRFALPTLALGCVLATPFIDDAQRARPRATNALLVGAAIGCAVLSAWPLARDLLSRVRHQSWARYQFYDIPELIDMLPPCSVVVNYNSHAEFWKTFALAGKHLTNTVVPPWEAGRAIDQFPQRHCPIYVVDREPFVSPEKAARLAAAGYEQLALPADPRWRVWRRPAP